MKNKDLSVSIVLPNWNGANLLNKNLPLVISSAPGAEIVVTDDASDDDSVSLLKTKFPGVKVVINNQRQGFAGNVNSGVAACKGDIVVLINTDVRPQKGFLIPLVRHFKDSKIFAVGCLEESHEPGKIILRGRGVACWEKGFFIHARGEVDQVSTAWVSGGSGAFRKKYWEELGGMDTLYNPFYWEDIDLSYRALKAGYKLAFETKSVVGHFHEEGKIKREYSQDAVKRIAYRNQFIFIWKNLSDPKILAAHVFWTPVRLTQALLRNDLLMWQGYFLALFSLWQIWQHRTKQSKFWRRSDRYIL